ncbi:phytoene/squalene synthase family protein [Aminobacter sp. HY435]|uniref:phytoene/squalene synthase family protein n=1 Tax=Aminobacter sp. HY435 TaxID=2970917 RepID=UPI0022B99D00|nr:phytoene/squalene synthase family protein [Aminobacter sp. HY435]
MEQVRGADRDRYLTALYAPEDKRQALLALYAFNAEIAGVRDRIREPMPGEIRLQWWRDVIKAADPEAGAGHPVAEALVAAIAAHKLPAAAFDNYLEARIFDLYDDPMPSRTDLEGYCGETASAVIQLAALVLDPEEAPGCSELSGHAGCAQAITGLLRLLPIHRSRSQCFAPQDMLASVGIGAQELIAGEGQGATLAVRAMAALAREHLAAFEKDAVHLPESLRAAYLPLALTSSYLDRIEADPAAALRRTANIGGLRSQWLVFRKATRGWR